MSTPIRKLFALLTRPERMQFYLLLALMILMAALETAGVASIMPFMAVVTNPEVIETSGALSKAYAALGMQSHQQFMIVLGIGVLGLLVCSNLLKATNSWLTLTYHNKLNYVIARRLLAKYMAKPYTFYLNRNTADLAKNVLVEVRTVIAGVLSPGTVIVSSSLGSIAIMGLLVAVNWQAALAIAVVLGGSYGTIYLVARRNLGRISAEQVDANSKKFKAAREALGGIKDLKVLSREGEFLDRFAAHAKRHARNNVVAGVIADLPRYALETIAFGGIVIAMLYFLMTGRETAQIVPLLALYAFAGYRLLPALQQVFSSITTLRFSVAALDVLYDDFAGDAREVEASERQLAEAAQATPLPFERSLELRDVVFHYPDAPTPALRGISLQIEANTTVGFVGATGSGKTTTIDLILGLLSPTEGQLLADDTVIDAGNLANWRRNIGYVPQHIYICDDTIVSNIALGVPRSEIDMEAVRRAARIANLAEFIETELPNGYDTEIGEHGVRLSGGQRQRIGIARALYRDPSLLVLDEATSALDGITEESVMSAIRNLSRKKTVIMIAHRLTTVRECDVIYLLEHGSVVAQGTYDSLKQQSRWFRTAAGS